jgi:hypothetical protein
MLAARGAGECVQERPEFHPDGLRVGALLELHAQQLELPKNVLMCCAVHLARRASMPIHRQPAACPVSTPALSCFRQGTAEFERDSCRFKEN